MEVALGLFFFGRIVSGPRAEAPQAEGRQRRLELLEREPEPLLDTGPFLGRCAEELFPLSWVWGGVGQVQGDGVALDEQEAICALKGGDLAEGKLG